MKKYNVTYHINNGEGKTAIIKAKVEFVTNPDDYGNGTYMAIEGSEESFGESYYDIRYDMSYTPGMEIPYIVSYYAERYSKTWKLIGIRVHEADEEE